MSLYKQNGKIEVILGPMFSGKSTELLRRIRRYIEADRKTLLVRYTKDLQRTSSNKFTHNGQDLENSGLQVKFDIDVNNNDQFYNHFDVIGIDEGQFFKNIVSFSEEMANRGKIIIVSALDGTFQRKEFNQILSLIPLSESVKKLSAICYECKNENGSFTKRLDKENQNIESIGGKDDYRAVCRTCFFK